MTHEYDSRMSFRLAASIVRGGSVLSVGFNSLKLNRFIENSLVQANMHGMHHLGTHAEVDAVLKIRAKVDLTGTKIFVARVRPGGELGMAKPCRLCQHILGRYGVVRAVYSIDDRTYGVMRII